MYYILSLAHTNPTDEFITLWRSANSGYCLSIGNAGLYETPEKGYHDSEDCLPVVSDLLEELTIRVSFDGERKYYVPNCKAVWKELGIVKSKGELKRRK